MGRRLSRGLRFRENLEMRTEYLASTIHSATQMGQHVIDGFEIRNIRLKSNSNFEHRLRTWRKLENSMCRRNIRILSTSSSAGKREQQDGLGFEGCCSRTVAVQGHGYAKHPHVFLVCVVGGKKPGTVRSVLQRKEHIQTSVISLRRTRMFQGIQIPSRVRRVTYASGDR